MFNETVLLHFKFFLESLSKTHKFYKRFIFLENANELVTLHGLQYEQEHFDDANGRNITILGSPSFGFPQLNIINLLQQIIHFKKMLFITEYYWQSFVLIGLYDMNLLIYSGDFLYQSLHPITSGSQQIFVVNMGMIGIPTYFVELFDVYLWIAFLVSFTIIGLLSTLGIYLLQRYTTIRLDYLSWYSMFTNQGGEDNSRLLFPKILLISLSIIAIMFHGSFEAFLSSYLAIRNPDIPFTNLDGLIQIPDYSICTPYGTSSYTYLMSHLKSDLVIDHRVNNKNCPKEFQQQKLTVQHDKFKDFCPADKSVFFVPTVFKISNDKCPSYRFVKLREKYGKQYKSILVSPGFKYREQFNRGMIRLGSTGIINRFEVNLHKLMHKVEHQLGKSEHDPTIDFHQTQIILLIPVIGMILGIIILLVERLIYNY